MSEKDPQRNIPKFHLISWCGNFVERHSFRESPETLQKLCVSTKFLTMKVGEISVFYEVDPAQVCLYLES